MTLSSIQHEAEQYGICKIVPPSGWVHPCQMNIETNETVFPTKHQRIDTLQEGIPFEDGGSYTAKAYKEQADKFFREWCEKYYGREPTLEELSREYWDIVETRSKQVAVDYGNDLDTTVVGSGFLRMSEDDKVKAEEPDMFSYEYYKRTAWNLNNLPGADGSVLRHITTPINGINVPWLYFGMLFSTFCWHNEDNYQYSINYNHFGREKQWYGIPGNRAKQFEKVAFGKNYFMLMEWCLYVL